MADAAPAATEAAAAPAKCARPTLASTLSCVKRNTVLCLKFLGRMVVLFFTSLWKLLLVLCALAWSSLVAGCAAGRKYGTKEEREKRAKAAKLEKKNRGKPTEAPKEFAGFVEGKLPTGKPRYMTDVLFLLLLLAGWFCMTVIGLHAVANGVPERLTNGVDYKGRICGADSGVKDLEKWKLVSWFGVGMCTAECPSETRFYEVGWWEAKDKAIMSCRPQEHIDHTYFGFPLCDETADEDEVSIIDAILSGDLGDLASALANICLRFDKDIPPIFALYYGDCLFDFGSTQVINYCVTTDLEFMTDAMESLLGISMEEMGESASFITDLFADLYIAAPLIFGFGFMFALILAFAYSAGLRVPIVTKLMIWTSIWAVYFFLLAVSAYAYYTVSLWRIEEPQLHSDTEIRVMKTLAQIGFALSLVWLMLVLWLKDRLQLAIGLVIATAGAIGDMPIIVFVVPLLQFIGFVAFAIPWCYFSFYIASLGSIHGASQSLSMESGDSVSNTTDSGGTGAPTPPSSPLMASPIPMPDVLPDVSVTYKTFEYDDETKDKAWFMLFMWYWTTQFIVALGMMFTIMCIACWYFTRDKKAKIGNRTVFDSVKLIVRYHAGTAAFGAFLIACVKFIRAVIAYTEAQCKGQDNRLAKFILACMDYMMSCIERCVKFITLNAYIQTCIWGTSFCTSAKNAFFLIMRNLARIAVINAVAGFVVLIGKVFVTVVATGAFYYLISENYEGEMKSFVMPTFMVCLLAWFTATMFFELYTMAITTLLQCFVADEEMFSDEPYAQGDLKTYIESHAKVKSKKDRKKPPGGRPEPEPEEVEC